MNLNDQLPWRPLACRIVMFAAFAGPVGATRALPSQLDVSSEGGDGPVVASFYDATNAVGSVVALYTFDYASRLGANSGTAPLFWSQQKGVTATNGAFGGAGAFVAGISSYWQSNFSPGGIDLGKFSVSMHVRGAGRAWHDYLSIGSGTSTIMLEQSESGSVIIVSVGDTGGQVVHTEGTSIVNDGNWHHLGLVSDGTSITLYIDGVAEGTPSVYSDRGTITSFQLASRFGDSARAITVDMDDVGIFNKALSPAEMAHYSNHAIPRPAVGSEPVDPRFPEDRPTKVYTEGSWRPWVRIRQLEAERGQLLTKISVLPQHDPKTRTDYLGYHSLFEAPESEGSLVPHQLDIKTLPYQIDAIALAPAFNPEESGAYAFPKRFKIEVLNDGTDEFEDVVDWMGEDFPDPGPYPVFFSDISLYGRQVRITVPQGAGESGVAYFALGEIYLFRRGQDGQIGDNMVVWPTTEIEASDSFTMPPIWDTQYLSDGMGGFGFPLSDKTVASEDLLIRSKNGAQLPDKVQFTLDLGQVQDIGPIDFWPAEAPYLLALPSFGFPEKISVELSTDPDFKTAEVIETENANRNIGDLFSIKCKGYDARYIRITMEGLREYKGKKILGLGEISASHNERVWSVDCRVTAEGIPDEYLDQLPHLVDGFSRQRRILPQGEWIKGLAKRRPLDRRLAVVDRELALARETWRVLQFRISIWSGVLLGMGLIFGRVFLKRQRRRVLKKLKLRITRDLHDEVGSNLGSISLAAEDLKHVVGTAEADEEINNITLLAREACASLREVVWVIDQSTIRLPQLIQKLVERAERVLEGMELFFDISADCPDRVVSLKIKRHLVMFFKEAVHNCARHSGATRVWIDFLVVDQCLKISIRDDGCGFNSSESVGGWGLDSMKERAEELGGEMELISQEEKGTTITLKIRLETLDGEPSNAYTTSN